MFSAVDHVTLPLAAASWLWAARVGVIVLGIGVWHWSQAMLARRVNPTAAEGGSIRDQVHDWTAGWHRALVANPRRADALLIASSLGIDALGLWLMASAIFGATFAPFLGLILVYALRQVCQVCCALPTPPGMIWRSPGFPSLLVTYGTANDLFFSGHTALAVYGAASLAALGPWRAAVGVAVVAFEAGAVLVLRAHYTMDVLAGAIAALLAYDAAGRLAPAVDGWLARLVG
jgi:membrane-associated phospholipid phosphatase